MCCFSHLPIKSFNRTSNFDLGALVDGGPPAHLEFDGPLRGVLHVLLTIVRLDHRLPRVGGRRRVLEHVVVGAPVGRLVLVAGAGLLVARPLCYGPRADRAGLVGLVGQFTQGEELLAADFAVLLASATFSSTLK